MVERIQATFAEVVLPEPAHPSPCGLLLLRLLAPACAPVSRAKGRESRPEITNLAVAPSSLHYTYMTSSLQRPLRAQVLAPAAC